MKTNETKRMIWTSDLYFDGESMNDWAKSNVDAGIWEEMPEEGELWDMWRDEVTDMWYDERANLNMPLCGYVVAVAETDNLNEILWEDGDCDFAEVYADEYNIRSRQTHHDGTHRILYRLLPWEGGDEVYAGLLRKAKRGELTVDEVVRNTQSLLPYVASVYGWPLRNYRQREKAGRIAEEERKRHEENININLKS